MITIATVGVYVDDQSKALAFYTATFKDTCGNLISLAQVDG